MSECEPGAWVSVWPSVACVLSPRVVSNLLASEQAPSCVSRPPSSSRKWTRSGQRDAKRSPPAVVCAAWPPLGRVSLQPCVSAPAARPVCAGAAASVSAAAVDRPPPLHDVPSGRRISLFALWASFIRQKFQKFQNSFLPYSWMNMPIYLQP